MTYSTWGMWNENLKALIKDIREDQRLNISKEALRSALLHTVINECLDESFAYYRLPETMTLTPRDKMIGAYKKFLDKVKPSLAAVLQVDPQLLAPHTEKFKAEALGFSTEPITLEYLTKLATDSQKAKVECIKYGMEIS
jgi:hypothetical protein